MKKAFYSRLLQKLSQAFQHEKIISLRKILITFWSCLAVTVFLKTQKTPCPLICSHWGWQKSFRESRTEISSLRGRQDSKACNCLQLLTVISSRHLLPKKMHALTSMSFSTPLPSGIFLHSSESLHVVIHIISLFVTLYFLPSRAERKLHEARAWVLSPAESPEQGLALIDTGEYLLKE